MKSILAAAGNFISAIMLFSIIVIFAATFTGTIVYLLWDPTVSTVFPGLVEKGIVSAHLTWWTSVKLVWLIAVLFATNKTAKKTTEE